MTRYAMLVPSETDGVLYARTVFESDQDPATAFPDIASILLACPPDVCDHWLYDTVERRWLDPAVQPPPVPSSVAAWAIKALLDERGILPTISAAVQTAGGDVKWAFMGADRWARNSKFIEDMGPVFGFTAAEMDQMFRDAAAKES